MVLTFLCVFILLFLWDKKSPGLVQATPVIKTLGALLTTWLLITSALYLFTPIIIHDSEVSALSIATAWLHGQPIYTALDDPNRYSLLYGPSTYLVPAVLVKVFDHPLFFGKLGGVISLWLSLFLFYQSLKTLKLEKQTHYIAWLVVVALIAKFRDFGYSLRPDSYSLLCGSLGLWIALQNKNIYLKYALLGLCAGLATTFKIHGFLYVAPAVALIFFTSPSWTALTGAIVLGLLAAYSPFLIPGVSASNYILWLKAAASHGFHFKAFAANVNFILPLVVLLLLFFPKQIRNIYLALSFLAIFAVVTLFASKYGAEANHYMPLFFVWIYLLFKFDKEETFQKRWIFSKQLALMTLVFSTLYAAIDNQKTLRKFYFKINQHWAEYNDLKDLTQGLDGIFQIGFNEGDINKYKSFYEPYVVHKSRYLFIEPVSVIDQAFAGLTFPESTYQKLESCAIKHFILPKQGEVLSYISPYTGEPMYPALFLEAFLEHYTETKESEYYRLYTCS